MSKALVIHPALLAAYPVLFLYAGNAESVVWTELFVPLGIAVAGALALFGLLCFLLRDRHRAGVLASLFVFLFFTHGHATRLLAPVVGLSSSIVAASTAAVLAILGAWAVARTRRQLRPATVILNGVSGFLVISTALFFLAFLGDRPLARRKAPGSAPTIEVEDPLPIEPPAESARAALPNIYYIVPDGYARADVLADPYGWDNSAFLDWLRQKGFYVASRSSANYDYTTASIACALNVEYLDALAAREGASSTNARALRRKVTMSRLVEFLKRSGYTTVSFPSGYWLVDMETVDHYITPARDLTEFQAALLGETALAPMLRALDWLAPVEAARSVLSPHAVHRARVLHALDRLVDTCDMDGPLFVYAHLFPPHPPFVFGPDGEPRQTSFVYGLSDGRGWHERTGGSAERYMREYRDQVAFVNSRLMGVIEALLTRSRRPPVIVLMSDHGPRSSPDEEDYGASADRERLGILAACYLPDGDGGQFYDSISPVNVVRVVLNRAFDARLPLLPDRHYRSRPGRPYDFVDVTDRVGPVPQTARPEL